ncbi:MAG: toll/interleukin-1 receptor domain-containing protein [Rhodocyclaceae bacterium]|nr:toll/interleukin-1 receptor domain-containing protein [Rhodocyclaceae bacterium]MBX3669981.1 toll/interleukin-1 receptor domain-containing protein [Rhodocyclaceae bacterium]
MAEQPEFDAFISYSSRDEEWASRFAAALQDQGVHAWFDRDQLEPGDHWQDKMQNALRTSPVFILILGAESANKPWTYFELGAALAGSKKIIPVLTGEVDVAELPPYLQSIQVLREKSPEEAGRRAAMAVEKRPLPAAG